MNADLIRRLRDEGLRLMAEGITGERIQLFIDAADALEAAEKMHIEWVTAHQADTDAAWRRVLAVEKDAARLDWLERNAGVCTWKGPLDKRMQEWLTGPQPLRDAIDAAMKEGK